MVIDRIGYIEFCKFTSNAFAACDKQKIQAEDVEAALMRIKALLSEESQSSGFRIVITGEEEIDELLLPFLRWTEEPMVAVIAVSRDVPLGLLNRLPAVRRHTASAVIIPMDREKENVTMLLTPVAKRYRHKYSVDGLAATLFPRRTCNR